MIALPKNTQMIVMHGGKMPPQNQMGSVSSSPVSFDSSSIGIDSFGIGWIAADSSSHQLATKTASAVGEVSYCYASTGNSAGLSSIWFLIVLNSSGNLPSQEE